MKAQPWSYTDEAFARSVHIVPDFEPERETLVLLGPQPLTLWELLGAFGAVSLCIASAGSVVALLWWLAKLL